MGAQPKGSVEPPPDDEELKARMLNNVHIGLVFRDLTPVDLGKHMGWNDTTRSRRLNGHRDFPVPELLRVARYLDVSLDDLFLPRKKFIERVSQGMSREELLRKLAYSACWGADEPTLEVVDLTDDPLNEQLTLQPPADLEMIVTSAAG